MELNLEEQTLIATFRSLDDLGKKELLRHASQQLKRRVEASQESPASLTGQCRLKKGEQRHESSSEPITE